MHTSEVTQQKTDEYHVLNQNKTKSMFHGTHCILVQCDIIYWLWSFQHQTTIQNQIKFIIDDFHKIVPHEYH